MREQIETALHELCKLVPEGETVILVDNNEWERLDAYTTFSLLYFLKRDGAFWSTPPDNETAIKELESMRQEQRANFIARFSCSFT